MVVTMLILVVVGEVMKIEIGA